MELFYDPERKMYVLKEGESLLVLDEEQFNDIKKCAANGIFYRLKKTHDGMVSNADGVKAS